MTRKEWWNYGFIKGDTIIFEPLDIMIKRMIAEQGSRQSHRAGRAQPAVGGASPSGSRRLSPRVSPGELEILKIQQPEFQYEGRNMNPSPRRSRARSRRERTAGIRGSPTIPPTGCSRIFSKRIRWIMFSHSSTGSERANRSTRRAGRRSASITPLSSRRYGSTGSRDRTEVR